MTTTYKIHIEDREYTKWTYFKTTDFVSQELPTINPSVHKFFTNDVFSIDDSTNTVKLLHSSIRICDSIPGVLILKNNKTYGRSKNGKLLYKCIPDDRRLPSFLIAYEMKLKHMGFSKVFANQYITFNFTEWNDKHPHGMICQMIGSVDILDNFYEYQLYCKSLNASIQKFTKDTVKRLHMKSNIEKYPNIEDRTDRTIWNVFTIDPPKSLDFDDGFSIKTIENGMQQLSMYISNVTIWMDVLNLWESFSRRISTIYLPDRKRPMLPSILSDCLCSLQSGNTRIAFVMDVFIDKEENICDIKYSNCKINVYKNFCYEEPSLLKDKNYQTILSISKMLSKKYKYINNVRNSHDVVSYLMIFMNYNTAKELLKHNNGIFRSTIIKKDVSVPDHLPEEVCKFIKIWNSAAGQYIALEIGLQIKHELLEMDAYIHITSPIRRLVDLLNIIKFQQNTGIIQLSTNASRFYDNWLKELDYINTTMRSIRRVQSDCSLLQLCSSSPEVMEKIYDVYIFDKIVRNDGLYQYIAYLPELHLASRVTLREDIYNYTMRKCKMYLFNDEDNFKKKIRLQLQ